MADKPQQQTLSVRISEGLRARLERARKLASKSGESVSTSEIAKQLLESAREDRLEVVDMLAEPTAALLQIRRKGEAQLPLSQAEWTVLVHFVQQGVEAYSAKTPNAVSRESWIAILDAFAAAYALRGNRPSNLDTYYLGNLPDEYQPSGRRGGGTNAVAPDLVRRTVAETRKRLADPDSTWIPMFIGRSLYRLLEDKSLGSHDAIDKALRPYWPALWRLAARGHYALRQEPVRDAATRHEGMYLPPLAPISQAPFTLSFTRGDWGELSVLLSFPGERGPLYPINEYPRIAEFRALLAAIDPPRHMKSWTGEYFFAYAQPREPKIIEVWFRALDNGITFGFTVDEWSTLRTLFRRAWESQDLQQAWDRLTRDYGEL
jgi:hypothetical protein